MLALGQACTVNFVTPHLSTGSCEDPQLCLLSLSWGSGMSDPFKAEGEQASKPRGPPDQQVLCHRSSCGGAQHEPEARIFDTL